MHVGFQFRIPRSFYETNETAQRKKTAMFGRNEPRNFLFASAIASRDDRSPRPSSSRHDPAVLRLVSQASFTHRNTFHRVVSPDDT